jgi:hypothetical protein
MSDIVKSFTFLQASIPQWLDDITAVEEKVTAMQADVVKTPMAMSPFSQDPPDAGSSIRRARMNAIAEEAATSISHGAQTDPVASRKRKSLSVLSGRASGPLRYRRTMVVLTYDGNTQKSLELLVRAIGTGRNLLRKAKMEAKLNELGALAGSSEDEDEAEDDDEAIASKISYRPRMSSMRARAAAARRGGAGAPIALFDSTDKTLEHAQSLCEKAAHILLRDGDCRKEMGSVRKSLADVLETAKTEVTKCDSAQPPELQEDYSHETSDTSLSSVEPSYQKHFPQLSMPPTLCTPKNMLPCMPTTTSAAPLFMDIEVDDDDDEDEPEFVMPVRFTSRFAARA